MFKKKILLIPVMFLLFISLVSAVDVIKSIMNVGPGNGTDTRFISSSPTADASGEAAAFIGDIGSGIATARMVINFSMLTKDVIPAGVTINWFKIEYKTNNDAAGDVPLSNIRVYPIKIVWEESDSWDSFGAGGGGLNDTDFNGEVNLVEEFETGFVNDAFNNLTLINSYAQNFFDGNLGVEDEGIIIISYVAADYAVWRTSDSGTATDRISYHINYSVDAPPVADPDLQTFTITTIDTYDGSSINQFNVSIFNGSFSFNSSTENGTILIDNRSINSFNASLYNITFSSNETGGYINRTFLNINISDTISFEGDIFQAILRVNATEVISGTPITDFNFSVLLQSNRSNSSGFTTLFLKAGEYNFSADTDSHFSIDGNISINNFEDNFFTVEMGTANITVTAFSGEPILSFNITSILLSTGFVIKEDTSTGTVLLKAIVGTFNVSINATGFTSAHEVVTVTTNNNLPNITFNLFSESSINITIIDEELNEIINTTITTLIFDHEEQKFTATTPNGTIFRENLFNGVWDLQASTPFHSQRSYMFTIVPESLTELNIYLLNSTNGESKIFTVKNVEDERLTGATISVANRINNTFVTVAQRVTDFAGQANIFLRSDNTYRFTVEASGFSTKIFDLEPIASAYDIVLTGTETVIFTNVFEKVSYAIIPESPQLIATDDQNISFIVSSPEGLVTYFGLNSSFNNISVLTNVSGSVAGGTASISLNTSNFTGATVPITFFLKLSGEDIIEIDKSYYLAGFIAPGNASAISFADKYSDDFTAVMKSLFIVLLAVGVIISLAEVGAPAAISGVVGAIIIIAGAVVGWIPVTAAFIVGFILIGMFILRRGA